MVPVRLVPESSLILPESEEGDRFFGLEPGTNGTAAESRRALVAPSGFHWLRSNGLDPKGLALRPPTRDSDTTWSNPWNVSESGRLSSSRDRWFDGGRVDEHEAAELLPLPRAAGEAPQRTPPPGDAFLSGPGG